MSLTRIGLIARLTLPPALAALAEAARWLSDRGCTPVVEEASAQAAGPGDRWTTASREALPGAAEAIVAFGGDGTLLDAASLVAHSTADVPVLGVNLGRLGFLTEVTRADMTRALEALVSGDTRTETRHMLIGRVERRDAVIATHLALNDIVMTRSALPRMIEIDVSVGGQSVCHVKADGLILATATGSTAYNLSAGGPIVHPAVDAVILTPIAPHTLTNRPLVLSADDEVVLELPLVDPESAPPDLLLTFDGQFGVPIERGDRVVVGRAPRRLRLVRTTTRTHFDVLREKLKWGHG
jgi:NAD+ kinase